MKPQIYALFVKEILAFWRDKKSRFILIVPPLLQLLIFAQAATLDVKNVTMGILNLDNGKQGFELSMRFAGSPTFKKIIFLESVPQITPFIDNQNGFFVLSIPEDFSRNLEAKKPANVQLILDGRKSNTTQITAGYATQIINQFSHDVEAHLKLLGKKENIQLVPRNWFNANLYYTWFTVPGLVAILTMLIGLIVTALSVARERELGTFDQLLVSPLTPFEIMLGKSIPAVVISMVEGTIIVLAAILFFDIPFNGSALLLYVSMFVYICSIVGIGLFISALSATQQQAILGAFVFMSPATILSGFATPIENMPTWLQYVTYANPPRYFLRIARGTFLKDLPPSAIFHNIWPMAIIAVVTLSVSMIFFRRRLQ